MKVLLVSFLHGAWAGQTPTSATFYCLQLCSGFPSPVPFMTHQMTQPLPHMLWILLLPFCLVRKLHEDILKFFPWRLPLSLCLPHYSTVCYFYFHFFLLPLHILIDTLSLQNGKFFKAKKSRLCKWLFSSKWTKIPDIFTTLVGAALHHAFPAIPDCNFTETLNQKKSFLPKAWWRELFHPE